MAGFSVAQKLYNEGMRIAIAVILCLVLVFVATQIFSFLKEEHSLAEAFSDVNARLGQAEAQEQSLSLEVNYLANPQNLEEELRSRFDYAKPGETMIVILPSSTSTGPASSTDAN